MTVLFIFTAVAVLGILYALGKCKEEQRLRVENWNAARRKRGEK